MPLNADPKYEGDHLVTPIQLTHSMSGGGKRTSFSVHLACRTRGFHKNLCNSIAR